MTAPEVVWDSGEVTSSASSAVYAGPALDHDTSYVWRVRYWSMRTPPSHSSPQGAAHAGGGVPPSPSPSPAPSLWSERFILHTAPSAEAWRNASWIDGNRGALRRSMTLQNLTKMPAAFSFDLALLNAWSPAAMSVDVVPDKGELEPSESIELMVEFWPRQVRPRSSPHSAPSIDPNLD